MLVLTRKIGQGFLIGDEIEITITEISGDKVRVGINAPKDIKILRTELSQTVEANQAATQANSNALRALAKGLKMAPAKPGAVKPVAMEAKNSKSEPEKREPDKND